MILQGLKSGFLSILLILFVSSGLHTHTEQEIQKFSGVYFSTNKDTKQTVSCPICQFQRESNSFWNLDFLTRNLPSIFLKKIRTSFEIFIPPFDLYQNRYGRAPPILLPLS
ncbi:LIC10965 family protein [Leptospira kirschneri]|uniref:LIC10965 family protein n=1 Tax=Leptospira kirschneri TaxID=29507 RepID=UPI000278466A|nr:hypothetical protein [Leptospira kirschneri]EJO68610.1 hypothetical protein LEP1GSC044_3088 [Leptospira kirschneri serovar Grippotyphosa str. RM52]EKQ82657.1 hypothetical protein LEP1GSC064_1772 [Leptospira kirschneri serovar Grippotyphosa str. Moskva]EKR07452.1 hypothetical protein LEP1GSC122_2413 [Leptospira kirschneri serovar Valbuzzi str. 200702274]EMK03907.1 hypothetical protein LEP1GSC176_1152 [Leptospira kirschneri str. MMD1493]KON75742.1 Uncharacterized protein NV38_0003608 [Leptosp